MARVKGLFPLKMSRTLQIRFTEVLCALVRTHVDACIAKIGNKFRNHDVLIDLIGGTGVSCRICY